MANIFKMRFVVMSGQAWLRPLFFCICCTLFFNAGLWAQPASVQTVAQQILQQEAVLAQKPFVHINKDFFVTGENIWFSLYLADGGGRPVAFEKTAYIEIVGAEGKPAVQAQVALQGGRGEGALLLPTSVATGKYLFRAYTHAAKSSGTAAFFETGITIVNTTQRPAWASLEKAKGIEVRIFPEGGQLVYGLQNTTAVWCTNEYGEAVTASGAIVSKTGDTVVRFATTAEGRTAFEWTPLPNNEYNIVVGSGAQRPKVLPMQIETEGLSLQLKNLDAKYLEAQVKGTASFENGVAFLAMHTKAGIKLLQQLLTGGKAAFTWAKEEMQDGLSVIKLYDAKGMLQAERWWYDEPEAAPQIEVKSSAATYQQREQVTVDISSAIGIAEWADVSASVFLTDSLQRAPDMLKASLLAATANNQSADLLARTIATSLPQKASKSPAFYWPQYEGPLVTARITDSRSGAAAAGIRAFLSLPGRQFQFVTAVSDGDGFVHFNLKSFVGNREAIIQLDRSRDSNYTVQVLEPFYANYSGMPLAAFRLPEAWAPQLEQHAVAAQVQTAFGNNNAANENILNTDTLAFYGVPDKSYLLDDYTRFATLEEVMREYVTEVMVRRRGSSDHYQVYNMPYKQLFDADPLVLIDGVPFFDIAQVMAVDPALLKRLDVVSRRYAKGSSTYDGIVSFATYEGNLAGVALHPDAVAVTVTGTLPAQKFTAPQYSGTAASKHVPDQRMQLFWQPHIEADKEGKARIYFFTSDVPGRYAIVVKGITKDGRLAERVTYFDVAK